MNTKKYLKTLAVLAALPAFTISCTDVWDDHYGDGTAAGTNADAPTLLEHIQADAELSEFLRVAKYVGYDAVLSSPQSLTLWAPVITKYQADSIIAVYEAQKHEVDNNGNLRKDKDNYAITQFMQNHIALLGRSSSSLTLDSVRMWNGKYMLMTDKALNGIPYLAKNIVASNGIMYKLMTKQTFFPNLREVLELENGLDSASHFFKMFDVYELDEQSSVMQDIVDGQIIYADSVMNLSNELYYRLGLIQREDSAYAFLAPSNEVWKREYDKYINWFSYINDSRMSNRDSLIQLNARFAIARGRFFNINSQKKIFENVLAGRVDAASDSLINTHYVKSKDYYGLNVFFHPTQPDGILDGLSPVRCSNGWLYTDHEGRIQDSLTFAYKRYISPVSRNNVKSALILDRTTTDTYRPQSTMTTRNVVSSVTLRGAAQVDVDPETGEETVSYAERTVTFPELRDKQYVEYSPASYNKSTVNNAANVYFYLQNTFSNLYYNVYVVMVPEFARENYDAEAVLPVPFRVRYSERSFTPASGIISKSDPESGDFSKEINLTNDSEPVHKSGANFLASGTGVDVICIDKARKFNYASYNSFASLNPTERYRLETTASAAEVRNKIYSNTLRINRVIYIPFATEEEARSFTLTESDLSNLKEYKE